MNPLAIAGINAVKHSIMRTISVICVLLVIAGLSWAIYAGIIRPITKPNPSNTQQGQRDNYNYSIQPRSYFGCLNFRILRNKEMPIEVKK